MEIKELKEKNIKSLNFIFILRNKRYVRKNSAVTKKLELMNMKIGLKNFLKIKKIKFILLKIIKKK